MMTREQVRLQRLQFHVDTYLAMDAAKQQGAYQARIEKAHNLVASGAVTPTQRDGYYRVQGSQPEPYHVNGACGCADYQRNVQADLHYWCKHRVACRLYKLVEADLAAMAPHLHHYACGHGAGVACYQLACPDPQYVVCPTCELDPVMQRYVTGINSGTVHLSTGSGCEDGCPACLAERAERQAHDAGLVTADDLLEMAPELLEPDPHETPSLELPPLTYNLEPPYEPCPSRPPQAAQAPQSEGAGVPTAPSPQGLPEAPLSINVKVKMPGNNELMITVRGATDDDVLDRLPHILTRVEAALKGGSEETGWFRRLYNAVLPARFQQHEDANA